MSRNSVDRPASILGRPRDVRVDAAILDATLALFAGGGLSAVTFEGVAARAEVSRSGVYRRWRTREELVMAALTWRREQGERGAEGWAAAGSVAAVMTLFRDRAVQVLCDPQSLRLLGQVLALDDTSPVKQAYWTTIVQPRRRAFSALIDSARERGELSEGAHPEIILDLLAGALMYRALAHPEALTDTSARRYVDHVLSTLGLDTRSHIG